jgi:hypothetical protein
MRDGGVQNLVPRQDGETLVCMVHRRAPNYKVRHWPAGRFHYATMMSLAWARALRSEVRPAEIRPGQLGESA